MEITVTQALAELKLLDKRIRSTITDLRVAGVAYGRANKVESTPVEDFKKVAAADTQSVLDLIARRAAIKAAIVASNSQVTVTVAGKVYTVAAAVERKSSIEYHKLLKDILAAQYLRAVNTATKHNQITIPERVQILLGQYYGNQAKAASITAEEQNAIADPYREQNEAHLIHTDGLTDLIDKLAVDIGQFLAEIDYVLTISNSQTLITIPD